MDLSPHNWLCGSRLSYSIEAERRPIGAHRKRRRPNRTEFFSGIDDPAVDKRKNGIETGNLIVGDVEIRRREDREIGKSTGRQSALDILLI